MDARTARAINTARKNVHTFAKKSLRKDWQMRNAQGGLVGERFDPYQRIGIYVPGGTAPLVSTAVMTVTIAAAAGVPEIVVCTPADAKGKINDALLHALQKAGATEIYKVGGAQAVAAMAVGTASIKAVQKIAGPGNAFVVEAKRQLFGEVAIDLLPGPSEVLVIADSSAIPAWAAADLLAQAEHDPLATSVLITTSIELATAVADAVRRQLETLPTAAVARESLTHRGGAIVTSSVAEAIALANTFAPEHLCLLVEDPWTWVGEVRHAGGIFVGSHSPEAAGDYVAGPSHIMPTGQTARFASPLSVADFIKIISVIGLSPRRLAEIGPVAARLARAEGFEAHARAVEIRLKDKA
ncbi:MAG: histidinol dehydrogenase [Proteobacteria bacterium]|nr:histidinol dehydrogenase [Pseudomonadota bacterium]